MICLDTNVVVTVLNRRSSQVNERLLREIATDLVVLPAIALFELRYGIANATRVAENERRLAIFFDSLPTLRILPFEARDAEEAGIIRADLKRKGTPIGPYDVLIAAQARRRGAALVTANTREFARVPGLALQDWTAD